MNLIISLNNLDTIHEKKIFLCQLFNFSEDKINDIHDFIEYDEDYKMNIVKKPQWFHSAGGTYMILNNETFNNRLINYLIQNGYKNILIEICIEILKLDQYGERHIEIINSENIKTVIDQHNNKITTNERNIDIDQINKTLDNIIEEIDNLPV